MQSKHYLLAAALVGFTLAAHADVEKFALMRKPSIQFVWWPKIAPPSGWVQDRGSSEHYGMNAITQVGKSFNDADTILYARAEYKPQVPDVKSLAQYIARDREGALSQVPDLKIASGRRIVTKEGVTLTTLTFAPASAGNWERMAFMEEGDFFFTFAISARTATGYQKHQQVFEKWIAAYKRKP